MKWQAVRFSNLFHVKHGYAFKSRYFDSDGPYILLTPGSFHEEGGYRDQGDKTKFYTGDVPDGFVLDEGDLIVAMTEQAPGLLGSSAWIPASSRFLHNQRLGRIVDLNEGRLNKRFLYYLFNTREVRHQISASATGTKVRHTAPERIGQINVSLPPPKEQGRIADTLSAYDDLIENNRRRMALLEDAARQLYHEWFVRLRFPGHEHTLITNGVPEGWERRTLGDLAEITMGQSPESRHYNEDGEGLPFHQGVTDFGDRFVTHRIYSTALNRLAEPGHILCSVRAPVGRLNVTLDKIVIGRGLAALRSKTGHQSLLLQQLRAHFFKEDLIGGGAIFASVTKKEFSAQELLDPTERLKQSFEEVTRLCDEQLRVLHLQNQKLRTARDLLLPRLMTGEIAV
jgi:type I restriction enzyme, S subunit